MLRQNQIEYKEKRIFKETRTIEKREKQHALYDF
jgi:hypothetical protein